MFRRNFPNYALGFNVNVPLATCGRGRHDPRPALDPAAGDPPAAHQPIRLDVTNALIAVQQARAARIGYQDARSPGTDTAPRREIRAGRLHIFFVVQAQRDLALAQSSKWQP